MLQTQTKQKQTRTQTKWRFKNDDLSSIFSSVLSRCCCFLLLFSCTLGFTKFLDSIFYVPTYKHSSVFRSIGVGCCLSSFVCYISFECSASCSSQLKNKTYFKRTLQNTVFAFFHWTIRWYATSKFFLFTVDLQMKTWIFFLTLFCVVVCYCLGRLPCTWIHFPYHRSILYLWFYYIFFVYVFFTSILISFDTKHCLSLNTSVLCVQFGWK